MSIIGGPLPGQEKEDQWGNTNLIESWQNKTIGKELVDKATELAIRGASKIPEKQQQQLGQVGSFIGEKYQDARTLEGKEWLDPSAVVTAGAVRTVEGIGWLGEKALAKPIEFVGHNVLCLDPRAAAAAGIAGEIILTAGGAPKAAKGAKYLKSGQALDDLTQAAFKYADPDSVANLVYQTGGGVAPVPKKLQQASISTPLPSTGRVSRTAGGYMGRGTSGLSSSYINPKSQFAELFRKLKSKQIQGAGKHHHVLDEAFMGKALNTSDFKEVLEELNKMKIYPGDSPKNIIMMMDEGNLFLQSGKADFAKQLAEKGYTEFEGIENYGHLMRKGFEKQKKLIDDLFKNPDTKLDKDLIKGSRNKLTGEITQPEISTIQQPIPSGSSVNWKESLGLDINSKEFKSLSRADQLVAKQKAWANRFNRLGIDRKSIKFDPDKLILSKDHIDKIHYSVYNSPKFTQRIDVLNSIKDGSWYKLTPKQKANKITEVHKVQRNASINAAKLRLKTIKNYITENLAPKQAELLKRDPELLRKWIVKNPRISANLSWKEPIPDFKTLINPESAKVVTDELRTVFSTLID